MDRVGVVALAAGTGFLVMGGKPFFLGGDSMLIPSGDEERGFSATCQLRSISDGSAGVCCVSEVKGGCGW